VKVNRAEFDTLFSAEDQGRPLAERLSSALTRWAPRAWIVTDGPRPVWFAGQGAAATSLTPPAVSEVSPTGSGDVLHAAVLHAVFHHHQELAAALRQALPYAAANAAHATVADFPLNNLPRFGSIA
jgi:1-phosphofructokinase/tagatose 6-phosphate kinase